MRVYVLDLAQAPLESFHLVEPDFQQPLNFQNHQQGVFCKLEQTHFRELEVGFSLRESRRATGAPRRGTPCYLERICFWQMRSILFLRNCGVWC